MVFVINKKDDNTTNHVENQDRCMCINYETDMSNNMNITNNRKGRRCNKNALSDSDFCQKHFDSHQACQDHQTTQHKIVQDIIYHFYTDFLSDFLYV